MQPQKESGSSTASSATIVPTLSVWRRIRIVLSGSFEEWMAQRAASKGAALAFYTLFSMAPILVLVIAIAGAVFGAKAAQGELFNQLTTLVGPAGAEAVQLMLASSTRNPGAGLLATVIATIVLILGATTAFAELKDSLDEIWHAPPARRSGFFGFIRTRLLSFGLVLVLAFLLLVSLVVSAALAVLERYWGGLSTQPAFLSSLAALFSFGVIACLFAVIYKMLPNIRLSWHDVWIGALGTAALFSLGKYIIGAYLGSSGVANSYGAAGSVVALLLWVYYSAQIFFFGAEFTRQYALWFGSLQAAAGSVASASAPATPEQ
ncbi:MAG: putative ribonuclease [Herminiimonas sp.]|nr:putative ribonuclease [Herminiimonas sp.]